MKKTISILVIVMTFGLFGMQNVNAQATVDVNFTDNCSSCPVPGDWGYRVDITIYDQCDGGSSLVFSDYELIEGGDPLSASFQLTSFCSGDTEECYHIYVAVKKICPDGQGGYEILCSGKHPGSTYSCQELMDSNNTIPIPNITLN